RARQRGIGEINREVPANSARTFGHRHIPRYATYERSGIRRVAGGRERVRRRTARARHHRHPTSPQMRRRAFIASTLTAAAWPIAGRAQQSERVRRVGVLMPFPENDPITQAVVTTFTLTLERTGWVQGKNIRFDYRFAAGDQTLFKTYAAELVRLSPDALLASARPVVEVPRQQTRTIPIVCVLVADPVGQGFVQSLARPGGNITGFSAWDAPIMGKWLQLLKVVAPSVTRVAVIFNPD